MGRPRRHQRRHRPLPHGAKIDELLARQRASDGRGWYLTDHLGTVRDIAKAAGAVVAHLDYSSFGRVLGVSNPVATDRFLFTGRELDGQIALNFHRARYYAPELGQFISQDPLGFDSLDVNLYRYVNAAPLTRNDPTGTISVLEFASVIAFTASATVLVAFHTYKNANCKLIKDIEIGLLVNRNDIAIGSNAEYSEVAQIEIRYLQCLSGIEAPTP